MSKKLLLWLLLLPLVLAGYGGWQYERNTALHGDFLQLQHDAQMLEAAPGQETLEFAGKAYRAEALRQHSAALLQERQVAWRVSQWRQGFALFTLGSALLSLLAGGSILLTGIRAGRQTHSSSAQLWQGFQQAHRRLSQLTILQVVLVGGALCSLLLYELSWVVLRLEESVGEDSLTLRRGLIALLLLYFPLRGGWCLKRSLVLFQPAPMPLNGAVVDHQQAPGLWQRVEALAQQAGTAAPDNIVVGLAGDFAVTAVPLEMAGSSLPGRTLYFPLLPAALLSHQELAAIMAQELGQFTGEAAEYSLHFVPLYTGITQRLKAMPQQMSGWDRLIRAPVFQVVTFLLQCFAQAAGDGNRQRALAADQVGARMAGIEGMASALLRLSAFREVIAELQQSLSRSKPSIGNPLQRLLEQMQQDLPAVQPDLEQALSPQSASRLTIRARITALPCAIDEALLAQALRPVSGEAYHRVQALFTDVQSLFLVQQQESQAEIRRQTRLYQEQIRAVAPQAVFTESRMAWVISVLMVVLFPVVALLLLYRLVEQSQGIGTMAVLTELLHSGVAPLFYGLGGLTLLGLWLCVKTAHRGREPLLILTPTTLAGSAIIGEYPLHQIVDYQVIRASPKSGLAELSLTIAEGASLPVLRSLQGVRLRKKQRKLHLQYIGRIRLAGKKISDQALEKQLAAYLLAAHASQALLESGELLREEADSCSGDEVDCLSETNQGK